MMDIVQSLIEEGWYLSNEAVNKLSENGSITNIKVIISKALNLDLREIGVPSFPEDSVKGKVDFIPGNIVVQIQKVRNVSAPKANEESRAAPRMLKVALTDGQNVCQAVELESIPSLSLNTPPGTKLLLKGESLPLSHGMLVLQTSTTQILGGVVPQLIEKWELNRSLAKHTRGRVGEEGGPPPWISFGKKIVRPNIADRNFKSLEDGRDNKENAEFEAQRKDAIAEAARGGAKKVFGGGNARSLIDKNVKQIVEMGFSLDQAEQALQQARNNVNRALRILQKKEVASGGTSGGSGAGRGGRRRGGGDREDDGGGGGAGGGGGGGSGPKPSGKVFLFDYLEDKLPTQNEKETETHINNQPVHTHNQYLSHTNSNQKNSFNAPSHNYRGGTRQEGGGYKSRGGHNSGSDSRQSRDDRNQNQKPPRFQNQQRYQESNSYPNWSYNNNNSMNNSSDFTGTYDSSSVTVPGRGNFANTRVGRAGHDESYSENYNRSRHQSNHAPNYTNDYNRGNRRYDNSVGVGGGGVGGGSGGGGGGSNSYRANNVNNDCYSRQLIEAGMPEIPEFPFKDASVIPSLMSTVPGFFPPSGFNNNNQSQHQPHQHPTSIPPPSTQYTGGGGGGGGGGGKSMLQSVDQNSMWQWKVGDKCMAKYWEDNMYYNAEVTGLSKKTCVVRFLEYGNFEEVLQDDCIPIAEDIINAVPTDQSVVNSSHHNPMSGGNRFSGILEFRRGGTRPYIKSSDNMERNYRKNQPRGSQPMYIPPAQRKEPMPTYK